MAARGIATRGQLVAATVAAGAEVPAGALLLAAEPGQRLGGEAGQVWEAACSLVGCMAEGSSESGALVGGAASRAFLEELRQVRDCGLCLLLW